jgi:hypothetical protein
MRKRIVSCGICEMTSTVQDRKTQNPGAKIFHLSLPISPHEIDVASLGSEINSFCLTKQFPICVAV